MLDKSQSTMIPFLGGYLGVEVHLLTEIDPAVAESTLDCIFGLAVGELNSAGKRALSTVLDIYGGGDETEAHGERSYQVSLQDGTACNITLSFLTYQKIDTDVALGALASAVVPKIAEHAMADLISDNLKAALAASGYDELLEQRRLERLSALRLELSHRFGDDLSRLFATD